MDNNLLKGMTSYTNKRVTSSPFIINRTGIIIGQDTNENGWTVEVDGKTYYRIMTMDVDLSINDTVVIQTPNNNYNNMFILGKLKLS